MTWNGSKPQKKPSPSEKLKSENIFAFLLHQWHTPGPKQFDKLLQWFIKVILQEMTHQTVLLSPIGGHFSQTVRTFVFIFQCTSHQSTSRWASSWRWSAWFPSVTPRSCSASSTTRRSPPGQTHQPPPHTLHNNDGGGGGSVEERNRIITDNNCHHITDDRGSNAKCYDQEIRYFNSLS